MPVGLARNRGHRPRVVRRDSRQSLGLRRLLLKHCMPCLRWRRIAALVCAVVLAWLVGACGLIPGFGAPVARPVGVEVSNGTDLEVTLVVNGKATWIVPAHGQTPGPITADILGPMPWTVEARTSTDRLLTSMVVHDGDVQSEDLGNGRSSSRSVLARVDLSCGRLDMWAGTPASGPVPGAGVPGDCVP